MPSNTRLATALVVICVLANPASGREGPKFDTFGDPLPQGAVARLGTVRWRHVAPLSYLAFAPDGKSVISAGCDGLFRVWEYPSGKPLRKFGPECKEDLKIDHFVGALGLWYRYCPNPFAVSSDCESAAVFGPTSVKLYDVATGQERTSLDYEFDDDPEPSIWRIAFSPNGRGLAVLTYGGSLYVSNIKTGKLTFKHVHPITDNGPLSCPFLWVGFTSNGKAVWTLVFEAEKGRYMLRLFDSVSGEQLRACALPYSSFSDAALSPDGEILAVASSLLETSTGKVIRSLEGDWAGNTTGFVFSQDGKYLFARTDGFDSYKWTVFKWEVKTGKLLESWESQAATMNATQQEPMVLSPDGSTVAICGLDDRCHFLDTRTGKEKSISGHAWAVDRLAFAPNGLHLWTGDVGNTICKWDYVTARQLAAPSLPEESFATLVSRQGNYAVQLSSNNERGILGLDLMKRQSVRLRWPEDKEHSKLSQRPGLLLGPGGKTLAIRWFDEQILELYDLPWLASRHVFTISTGKVQPGQQILPGTIPPAFMSFSSDERLLAAYSDAQTIAVWDCVTGKKVASLKFPVDKWTVSVAFTPDNRSLIVDFEDGTIHMVELASGLTRRVFGSKVTSESPVPLPGAEASIGLILNQSAKVTFTPDGKLLVHGGPDRKLRVYEVLTGKEVAKFEGHEGAILAVAVSEDGKYAATASTDTTVLLWKLPTEPNLGAGRN